MASDISSQKYGTKSRCKRINLAICVASRNRVSCCSVKALQLEGVLCLKGKELGQGFSCGLHHGSRTSYLKSRDGHAMDWPSGCGTVATPFFSPKVWLLMDMINWLGLQVALPLYMEKPGNHV
jgi:hypothetical protein